MKKIFYLLILSAMLIASCQPESKPVDTTATEKAVNSLMDTYLKFWNARDVQSLTALLTDNGLFCGTDPSEFMDKKLLSEGWAEIWADTTASHSYTVDKRVIRVASDGNSALVVEQFGMTQFTGKLQIRLVAQAVKSGDSWLIDFISWSFIPKNEDLGKLFKALE